MAAHLQTSTAFASAMASGADWRDVGRKILESLDSIRTPNDNMNIGFIYVTTDMAGDLPALLTLLRDVTHITHWYGSTGQGICGAGGSRAGGCAGVAMIGSLPQDSFQGFVLPEDNTALLPQGLLGWMAGHAPVAAVTHGVLCVQGAQRLQRFRETDGLYAVGGFAGANGGLHVCDGQVVGAGDVLSGLVLDAGVGVMTATSFGCVHAGHAGRITAASGNVITTIDGLPAAAFLHDSIDRLDLPQDLSAARHGHVHAAFPVTGADRQFLMRNITNVDEQAGSISVAHHFERGDTIQFVYRDRKTASTDLTQVLTGLYARAAQAVGAANLKPKALLYFGCGARLPEGDADDEARLIAQVFTGVPMAGFYTAAEICNGHVYGYTGVIVLLL